MPYIYPKFSKYELVGVRFGGAGLGNLLFMWSRAIATAKEHDCELIWPTWPSIKYGPWIRREKDKRLYADLFQNRANMIGGIKKYKLLLLSNKIYCKKYDEINWNEIHKNDVIIGKGFGLESGELQMSFDDLQEYQSDIAMTITKCLQKKGKKALGFNADNAINVHVRLGDFSAVNLHALANGDNNTRIQIDWYVAIVKKIREAAGWPVQVNVFSDGTDEELAALLVLQNVRRITYGNSIADIVALSKAPVMIPSASSFSLWARFLGECSSISYPNQMKASILSHGTGFEVECATDDALPQNVICKIREIYSSSARGNKE